MITNRQYLIEQLEDPNFIDDSGASYEATIYYNIACPYFCGDEIALLKRENKALSDDNEMKCELNEELNKALDKTCEELETFDMTFNNADFDEVKNKEQWKEWSLHNEKI